MGRESYGYGAAVVVRGRESRLHGEGRQVVRLLSQGGTRMRNAEAVLATLHSRGQREVPVRDLYRMLFIPDLYVRAYHKLYPNHGALTPGVTPETVDGMSLAKIHQLIDEVRHERYRWTPVRRVSIAKRNGKQRPLGLPTWKDKLLQEVVRSLLEA